MIPLPAQYMLLSALGFSLMSLFVKLSAAQGIPVMEILAARALVSLVLSYTSLRALGIPLFGNNKPLLLTRGVVGFCALSMVYYSVTHLPLAVATVLQFLNPIFTALLGLILLKEAIGRGLIACIFLSMLGVIIITLSPTAIVQMLQGQQPSQLTEFSHFALLIGVCGAMMSALAYIIVRRLSPTEHPLVIVFYFPMVALPASLPFIYDSFVVPNALTLVYLLLVGCFTQVGQIYLTKAMKLESAGKTTAYSYLQVVFAALLGIAFLGEVPSVSTLVGAGLIMCGAYLNIAFKSRSL